MTSPAAADAPAPLPTVVPDDLACLRCGYSLKGLAPSSVCPECATPVERSLLGDLFRFSDPRYVRTLHRGAVLIAASIIAAIASVAAALLLTRLVGPTFSLGMFLLGPLLFVACGLLSLVGWWLLSTPDPRRLGRDTDSRARRLLRALVIAQLTLTLAGFLIMLASLAPGPGPSTALGNLTSTLGMLNSLAVLLVGAVYLRSLTLRIPDLRARRGATVLLWAIPIAIVVVGVGAAAAATTSTNIGIMLSCGGGLLLLFCALSFISLLERVRVGLKRIVREHAQPSATT